MLKQVLSEKVAAALEYYVNGSETTVNGIPFPPHRYLDPDMYSMMEDNSVTIRSKKFKKLTKAICGLVRSHCTADKCAQREGITSQLYLSLYI